MRLFSRLVSGPICKLLNRHETREILIFLFCDEANIMLKI
jgi:hypothetical protein